MHEIPTLKTETVKVETQVGKDSLLIRVVGTITEQEPGKVLNPYFGSLHEAIQARGLNTVKLDLRQLTLVNSSGIVCILRWVKRVQQSTEKRYPIIIHYDPEILWQRISLKSLQMMAPDVIQVTE